MNGVGRFLANVPFDSIAKIGEAHFHNFVYLLCSLIGLRTKTEYLSSSTRRMDGWISESVE